MSVEESAGGGMTDQHTPGPWQLTPSIGTSDGAYIEAADERHGQSTGFTLIVRMKRHRLGSVDRVPPDEINEANACLIAAAPALLDALRAAVDCHEDTHYKCDLNDDEGYCAVMALDEHSMIRDGRAAIAQATGK